jgi:UDP-N-acetylglucosamine transferase subunit ALG13
MAASRPAERPVLPRRRPLIFVTVGAQMPFDRLIKAVDRWADANNRDDVFAQIGSSDYRPSRLRWTKFLQPAEFRKHYQAAKVIIAHAGTGSIITALELGKPILVMPRRAAYRETRNDHQVATAERFRRLRSVAVAWDDSDLAEKLACVDDLNGWHEVGPHASRALLDSLRSFIAGGDIRTSLP